MCLYGGALVHMREVGSNQKIGGGGGGGAYKSKQKTLGPKAPAPRGVWGHAPPENLEILGITLMLSEAFWGLNYNQLFLCS